MIEAADERRRTREDALVQGNRLARVRRFQREAMNGSRRVHAASRRQGGTVGQYREQQVQGFSQSSGRRRHGRDELDTLVFFFYELQTPELFEHGVVRNVPRVLFD